jgi:integrase/recombinase XerC
VAGIVSLDIRDIDLNESIVVVREKGGKTRMLPLPQILCSFLFPYLKTLDIEVGPLFLSTRKKRISKRMIQHLVKNASKDPGFHLHAHLFRHTAATHINKVSGIDVTREILGHRLRKTTEKYIHLTPDIYVEYMRRHPFMSPSVKGVDV